MENEKPDAVQLKMTMDEKVAQGEYVNFANIMHNPTEFVLDLGRLVPGRTDVRILLRVLTNPTHAKQLWMALGKNIDLYERKFGQIQTSALEMTRDSTDIPS